MQKVAFRASASFECMSYSKAMPEPKMMMRGAVKKNAMPR